MFLMGEKPLEKGEESSPPTDPFLWFPPTTESGCEEEVRVGSQEVLVGVVWEGAGLGVLGVDRLILESWRREGTCALIATWLH